jgi:hypothetical protein
MRFVAARGKVKIGGEGDDKEGNRKSVGVFE